VGVAVAASLACRLALRMDSQRGQGVAHRQRPPHYRRVSAPTIPRSLAILHQPRGYPLPKATQALHRDGPTLLRVQAGKEAERVLRPAPCPSGLAMPDPRSPRPVAYGCPSGLMHSHSAIGRSGVGPAWYFTQPDQPPSAAQKPRRFKPAACLRCDRQYRPPPIGGSALVKRISSRYCRARAASSTTTKALDSRAQRWTSSERSPRSRRRVTTAQATRSPFLRPKEQSGAHAWSRLNGRAQREERWLTVTPRRPPQSHPLASVAATFALARSLAGQQAPQRRGASL